MNTWTISSLFCFITQIALSQSPVYLDGKKVGRGILKARANECFIITPAHVVGEDMSVFKVRGVRHSLFKAKLVETYGSDLAILRVEEGGLAYCDKWDITPNYDGLLADTHACFLEIADSEGGINTMDVVIVGRGTTHADIRPYFPGEEIAEGMSGSSLFTKYQDKKIFLGMLVSVERRSSVMVGNVLQASVINQTLNNFFKATNSSLVDSKKKEVIVVVKMAKHENASALELAQEASKILIKHYPEYTFIISTEKVTSQDIVCEITEQTTNNSDNMNDKKIHSYKSKIILTIRNQHRVISQEVLNGGAIDYSRERAQWLSVQNTLEESRQLVFENF